MKKIYIFLFLLIPFDTFSNENLISKLNNGNKIVFISGRIENLFNDDNMQNDEEIINNEVRQSDKKIPLYKLDDSIVEI